MPKRKLIYSLIVMFPPTVRFQILDSTDSTDLDLFFTNTWSLRKKVKLQLDTHQCRNISLGRILSLMGVLNKHRSYSQQYVICSTILVNSVLAQTLLKIGLTIIKSERPVEILLHQLT